MSRRNLLNAVNTVGASDSTTGSGPDADPSHSQTHYMHYSIKLTQILLLREGVSYNHTRGNGSSEQGERVYYKEHNPSSMVMPQRSHLTLRSSKQRPIPSGNQNTAASTPKGPRRRYDHVEVIDEALTEKTVASMWYVSLLQADHLRMIWRKQAGNDVVRYWVHVVVNHCCGHPGAHGRRRWAGGPLCGLDRRRNFDILA